MALGVIVGILVFDISGSVVLMGWTKPHCSSFDRVRRTRYIGASKTAGGKGTRCSGGPCVASECERVRERELLCERKLEKEAGKRKRVDLSVSSRKKKTQLFTSAENSTADPENIFLPPKENESAFQKAYKTFNLPNNDSSLGIKEFLLLRKEETIFIFRNELETYKALKKLISPDFMTTCVSEKIVKESEDFEGRDSGWTLDEILRLEVRTNHYSPFSGSSSFIEVPKQIAETKAIINVINKKDSQCFMWSILAAVYPNTSNPNKTSS
ncbi:c2H2-type domain-containing protein [Trichonephila clavipes]|nr:c2H2-type domain-containing protein [Trichonephila clavipes]